MYLQYLPSYDDFTVYVIMHGSHIGFLAVRMVEVKIMPCKFLRVGNMGQTYKRRIYLNYLPSYDDFTIVIIHYT